MFSISGKEKDDDDATPEPGTPYKIMTKHDEFVDHIEISGLRKRNVAKAVDGQETLLERVGLETGTSSKELKRMKSAFDKFLRNSNPIQRSQDDEADDDDAIDVVPMLEQLMNLEFPTKNQVPTPSQLIPKLGNLLSNRSVYHPGDWVEIEGLDMKWRLDMITRVIKTAPDDYDWNDPENKSEPSWTFTYNAGAERDVDAYDLRAPETGLKIIFGSRPWVWQQYALLKLEAKLRFQGKRNNAHATQIPTFPLYIPPFLINNYHSYQRATRMISLNSTSKSMHQSCGMNGWKHPQMRTSGKCIMMRGLGRRVVTSSLIM